MVAVGCRRGGVSRLRMNRYESDVFGALTHLSMPTVFLRTYLKVSVVLVCVSQGKNGERDRAGSPSPLSTAEECERCCSRRDRSEGDSGFEGVSIN